MCPLLQAFLPNIQVPEDFCLDTLLFVGFSGYCGRCFCSDPSLTVARYMILKLFISMRYRWNPMYLGCLFCLFVYVEFFRILLKLNGLYLLPCTINCQTRVRPPGSLPAWHEESPRWHAFSCFVQFHHRKIYRKNEWLSYRVSAPFLDELRQNEPLFPSWDEFHHVS